MFDTDAVNPFLQNLSFDTVKDVEAADRHRANIVAIHSGTSIQDIRGRHRCGEG